MIEIPKIERITVGFSSFNDGSSFQASAIHRMGGLTFTCYIGFDERHIDGKKAPRASSTEALRVRMATCAAMARAGVLKKIHAHLAIINPIDND